MGDDRIDYRRVAERVLSQSFMALVKNIARKVTVQSQSVAQSSKKTTTSSSAPPSLTEFEKTVMSKYTYYGWVPAVFSGFGTFCFLFGGLRYGAYRRLLRAQKLPSSASYHARASHKRHEYRSLDAPSTAAPTKKVSAPQPLANEATTEPKTFSLMSDEVVVQVQFLLVSALSLFVATMTGNATMDRLEFYRNLSEVPLNPGKSSLCRDMCPALLERTIAVRNMQSLALLYAERDEGDPKLREEDREVVLGHAPEELMQDPHTEDLEHVMRLVQNCQLRMNFETECRKRDNHRVDPSDGLVDVPHPGVPVQFLTQSEQ